jgi:uncharacterized protein YbjT (DUF2867 family)
MLILLTGATGHVGGRLLERLLHDGHRVRALSRHPGRLAPRPGLEPFRGDVTDRASIDRAFAGVDVAYYLVHSLDDGSFEKTERHAAETFAAAAAQAGTRRIVYLGGLAHGDDLSPHLRSRLEVGSILRSGRVPTVEFRASVVLGRGSASYELIRTLVEHLPALAAPSWLETRTQPIALDDVVEYLAAALDVELDDSRVYEIGGAESLTYRELIEQYATLRGLRMPIVELPAVPLPLGRIADALPEQLAPERARLAAKLVEGLRSDSAVEDKSAARDFAIRPRNVRDALAAAMAEAA